MNNDSFRNIVKKLFEALREAFVKRLRHLVKTKREFKIIIIALIDLTICLDSSIELLLYTNNNKMVKS